MNRLVLCEGADDFVFSREVLRIEFGLTGSPKPPCWRFSPDSYRVGKLVGRNDEIIVAVAKEGGKEKLLGALPGVGRLAVGDGPGRLGLVVDPEGQTDEDLARAVGDRLNGLVPDPVQSWRDEGMVFVAEPASLNFQVILILICNGPVQIRFKRDPRCLDQILVKATLESRPELVAPLEKYIQALEEIGVQSSPKVARAALMAAIDPATVSGYIGKVVGSNPHKIALANILGELSIRESFRKVVEG